ncbi:hypothetical protein ACFRCI_17365 [Streptomyces sp. NPDC056638]|uniref:hypothetical protein n=1 Tax=Streptomyces sp. NPDC056638 TaxID=3345887 RepID=UPI003694601D
MAVSLVKSIEPLADWEMELLYNTDIGAYGPFPFIRGQGRFQVNTTKFQCNTLRCNRTAAYAETVLIRGQYIVDDAHCLVHKQHASFGYVEGDLRPMASAVVDPELMHYELTDLIIR